MDFHQQDIRQFLEEAIPIRFSQLSPQEFEDFIRYLFEVDGFTIFQHKGTGQIPGIIHAEKEGGSHVILPLLALGDTIIGEENIEKGIDARELFQAQQGWVITTGTFSKYARKHADEAGIELWDWDTLYEALCQLFFEGQNHEEYLKSHTSRQPMVEAVSELKLQVKWEAAEGVGSAWYNLGLTIKNPGDRNIYLHLQLPALIDQKGHQTMADQWVDGEFVSGLIYAGASIRTNALFSVAKLGERPPGGRVVLTCHERLEVPLTYHLQGRLKGEACYIITYCYGIHSPEYQQMTLFRDHVLRKSPLGNFMVSGYYRLSPYLIHIAEQSRMMERFLKNIALALTRLVLIINRIKAYL